MNKKIRLCIGIWKTVVSTFSKSTLGPDKAFATWGQYNKRLSARGINFKKLARFVNKDVLQHLNEFSSLLDAGQFHKPGARR